ncbi:uncharacterized protein LOC105695375 [Orussus abietinus]|uniref:uncharacterized protein LOC105695375 n=1 Tax=Orussus abietinus TaxID=222816 RepID=UPI0006260B65|nr:uncharacterized protein LOC105695375 [Orussus abietinus]XP_012272312.1 uncharacterized protein LOC105695375 [Orussus abietinus]
MKSEVIYSQLNNPQQAGTREIIIKTSSGHSSGRMRRYYQAALVITAAVSLVSLLFYRHEYNKLRYVLEVLNFFGKPGQKGIDRNCTKDESGFGKSDPEFDVPLSSWQRLNDDLYIYSAYGISDKEVRAIGFGAVDADLNLLCRVYVDGKTRPVPGKFSSMIISNNGDDMSMPENPVYSGYHLICEHSEYNVPVGVSFLSKMETNVKDIPILPVKILTQDLDNNSSAVCIAPPLTKPMDRADMVSFLNFHNLVGMNNFIVYDFGVSTAFNKGLKDMAKNPSPYWKFTYTTVPWNFPFTGINPNIIKDVIEVDCLYRTYNKVMYVATMSWEEYIVLKYHHVVADLLVEFGRTSTIGGRYKLKTLVFCMQQKDDKRATNSTPVVLRKTHSNRNIVVKRPFYIYKPHETLNVDIIDTQEANPDFIFVNRYQYCDSEIDNSTDAYDPSILRFAGDMQNSPIYKKYVTGKLFSIE